MPDKMTIKTSRSKKLNKIMSPEKYRKRLTEIELLDELSEDLSQTNVFQKMISKNHKKEKVYKKIEYWFKKASSVYYFVNKDCDEEKDSMYSKNNSNISPRKSSTSVYWGK